MELGVGRGGDAGGREPHADKAVAAPRAIVAAAARAHLRMRALYASRRRTDVFLPRSHAARDDFTMRIRERRRRRSIDPCLALTYQLAACCKDGAIDAMVVADGDGLPLASSGDDYVCDEVAGRMVLVGSRIKTFSGTLLGPGARYDVQMTKIDVDGSELLVCAVGGSAASRMAQITRGAEGATRILST